mgnify:CR=1 FL=1
MATAVTSMRIPTELNERYSRLAKETGRSRSFYVNEALQEAIDRFEYEYGILKDIEDYRAGRLETYSIDEVRAHCGERYCRGNYLNAERKRKCVEQSGAKE